MSNTHYILYKLHRKNIPHCKDCNVEVAASKAIRCVKCSILAHSRDKSPCWKGGPEKYNERYRERICKYHLKRSKEDINYRLKHSIRTRVYYMIKENKINSSSFLIGCTVDHLKQHLEKQFRPGMSWENYGSYWEIDHIKPCISFDLSNPEEQKKCFHYTNLQPLTCRENRSKGSREL